VNYLINQRLTKGENIWRNEKVSRAKKGVRAEKVASAESHKRCTKQSVRIVIWKQRCPLNRILIGRSIAGSATRNRKVENSEPDGLSDSLILTDLLFTDDF
jgi:hypothetical protein